LLKKRKSVSNLEDEYVRLLRWYPRAWRQQNEQVVLGTFLDAARLYGLTSPSAEDRRSIRIAGLRQRAIGSGERSLVATVALAAGVAFSAFYAAFISWAPSHAFDGYVGPFSNPSIFVGLLLVLSLILSVCRVTGAARLVAGLAVAAIVAVGVLALSLGWLGPSLPAVVLFGAFGACGLSHSNKVSRGLLLVAASLCAVLAAESFETMRDQSTYLLSPFWQAETIIAVAGVLAAVLLAWPWHGKRRPKGAINRG
jgi:hypothetical protein